MLYETLLQGQIFLGMLYFGILCGIVFEAKNLIENTFNKQKIICLILDCVFMIISALIFIVAKNIVNFGEFRVYLLVSFIIGIIFEHTTIGYLVEKIFILFYNLIRKGIEKLLNFKPKNKFLKKILK